MFMNRREFIKYIASGAVAVVLPNSGCSIANPGGSELEIPASILEIVSCSSSHISRISLSPVKPKGNGEARLMRGLGLKPFE